ncbi:hypothetical protein HPB47_011823, partial [Ixodes persulcatus]
MAIEWESEVRQKVRNQETKQWLQDAQTTSTLCEYVMHKQTITLKTRLNDNSLGQGSATHGPRGTFTRPPATTSKSTPTPPPSVASSHRLKDHMAVLISAAYPRGPSPHAASGIQPKHGNGHGGKRCYGHPPPRRPTRTRRLGRNTQAKIQKENSATYPRPTKLDNIPSPHGQNTNIVIASTRSKDLARHIRDIPTLRFGDNEYEVTANIAAPDDSARGVVCGIPPGTTGQELIDNLYSPGYEILSARMIGKTSTALITFTGKQLPKFVIFEHAALPCSWYLPTRHACYICHEIGHRADVCSNPDAVKCVMCGVSNPMKGHECTPRCALCTGAHPTGSKECPKKLAHRPPTS